LRAYIAQGIAAEILFCGKAAKKIAADSPVFCEAKNAPKFFSLHFTPNSSLSTLSA
jgi:hypothetical protein